MISPDDERMDEPAGWSADQHSLPRRPLFGLSRPLRPSTPFWIALSTGVISLWCVFFAVVLTPVQHHRSQVNLADALRSHLADGDVPVSGEVASGTPVALLDIPDIGVDDLVVVEGTGADQLEDGPGHRRDTPMPGQAGISVLMGRGFLYGAPFADLDDLDQGALLTVTTAQGRFRYIVDGTRRPGDPGRAALVAPRGGLTLVSSEGIGNGFDATRAALYVDASLIDVAQPAVGTPADSIDDAETSMRGDNAALPDLAVWIVALIGVVVTAQWLQARWGRAQTTIVCAPVIVALLWLAAESASQLLPNLM